MDNPFKKRATEYFDDPTALLSLVSPEPVRLFFHGSGTALFDRTVIVVGTPGSGKTTLAQLIEFDTLVALARSTYSGDNKKMAVELASVGVCTNLIPQILAYRLPAGSSLREIWELPYSRPVRAALLRSFIQARVVLGWMRKLEKANIDINRVRILTKEDLETQARLIHADNAPAFRAHARAVEEKIFKVITALIAPSEEQLKEYDLDTSYEAFDVIEAIVVPAIPGIVDTEVLLKPHCIIDDAHELHPDQFSDIENWLRHREIKIARWVLTRVDAIGPDEFRKALTTPESQHSVAGTTPGRDRIIKLMQRDRKDRKAFRTIARDIARRYIDQMPVLRRHVSTLEDCLLSQQQPLTPSQTKELQQKVDNLIRETGFSAARQKKIRAAIPDTLLPDQKLAVYRILLHRETKRTPQAQLFNTDPDIPEPVSDLRSVKSALTMGADIQLMHEFGKPFYFSFDRLSDASNDNIEQFINLAGGLVDAIETKLLKGSPPQLDAKTQHQTLVQRAKETVDSWDFPHSESVRKLTRFISGRCLAKTMAPNAPLDDGANAFGILQSEMDLLHKNGGELIPVLHFALAYNAISLVENYECKGRTWCLFELGGLPIIIHGLTFNRGGFCEGHLSDLLTEIAS